MSIPGPDLVYNGFISMLSLGYKESNGLAYQLRRASRSRPGLGTGRAGLFTRHTSGGLILSNIRRYLTYPLHTP
jgi:hypothetical protein